MDESVYDIFTDTQTHTNKRVSIATELSTEELGNLFDQLEEIGDGINEKIEEDKYDDCRATQRRAEMVIEGMKVINAEMAERAGICPNCQREATVIEHAGARVFVHFGEAVDDYCEISYKYE